MLNDFEEFCDELADDLFDFVQVAEEFALIYKDRKDGNITTHSNVIASGLYLVFYYLKAIVRGDDYI